ncbi:MAG: prephenate dehydratase domain-containing protein [Eubacteriales bacterium]
MNEALKEVRSEIDTIDKELLALFAKRMEISHKVAEIKIKNNMAIVDEVRENELVAAAVADLQSREQGETAIFLRTLMTLSKRRQRAHILGEKTEVLLPTATPAATGSYKVGYQGIAGAWGEQATLQVFPDQERIAHEQFEDVFLAVKEKTIRYGIIPVENSQSGAIGEVYDLLRKYGAYVVGQTYVSVNQCLMGVPGTKISEIREVISHPQGFKQCNQFLRTQNWDLTACRNTAVAASLVAEKKDNRLAAIAGVRAAEIHGLEILNDNIVGDKSNKTRFIVIAQAPEYTEKSNMVSVIFRTAHRSGALCDLLFVLSSENINMARIESRPVADGKYCFFVDLEGNIQDPMMVRALEQASASCGFMEVLGCYEKESKQ